MKGNLRAGDYYVLFLCSFSDIEKGNQDTAFIHAFPYCDMDMEIMDVPELLMVTGFIARNTISRTSCKSCKTNLESVGTPVNLFVEEELGQYFDLINRGGLTYQSNLLFNVAQYVHLIIIFIRINNYTYRVHIKHLSTNYIKIFRNKLYYNNYFYKIIVIQYNI